MRGWRVPSSTAVFWTLLGLIALCLTMLLLPRGLAHRILKEGGPVESASALGYFAGTAVAWTLACRKAWRSGFLGGFLLLVLALRELDFHTRFTTVGVLKTRFFLSAAVPTGEKLIATTILTILTGAFVKFAAENWRPFVRSLQQRRPHAVATLAAILLILVSKGIDRFPKLIAARGVVRLGEQLVFVCHVFEETIELAIPILFIIALFQAERSAGLAPEGLRRPTEPKALTASRPPG